MPLDGLNMAPRPGEPESNLIPGMASPRPGIGLPGGLGAPGLIIPQAMPDTSGPGPTALQEPPAWNYDFDPANGIGRATFPGEVAFASGGPTTPTVLSFNTRTGAVTLLGADVSAVLTQAMISALAVGSFNTRTGAVVLGAADVLAAEGLALNSESILGAPATSITIATPANARRIDLWWDAGVTGAASSDVRLLAMLGATPDAATYSTNMVAQTGATVSGAAASQVGASLGSAVQQLVGHCEITINPAVVPIGAYGRYQQWEFVGGNQQRLGVWTTPSVGITGFRLLNQTGNTFITGSLLRAFAVL